MTPVDWFETFIFIGLSRLAFVSGRADFVLMFAILLGSLIWGRTAIALTSPLASVVLCAGFAGAACLAIAWRGNGLATKLIGALFAVQIIAAGLTFIGFLSPETSDGPAANFWTAFTVASLFQDFVLVGAYYLSGNMWSATFRRWCYFGSWTPSLPSPDMV
jgi:hypothetical protein